MTILRTRRLMRYVGVLFQKFPPLSAPSCGTL